MGEYFDLIFHSECPIYDLEETILNFNAFGGMKLQFFIASEKITIDFFDTTTIDITVNYYFKGW